MGIITDKEIEIKCPECGYVQVVTIEDAIKEKKLICGGCKKIINLKFEGDNPSKVENEIHKLLKSFSKKIDIKIKL